MVDKAILPRQLNNLLKGTQMQQPEVIVQLKFASPLAMQQYFASMMNVAVDQPVKEVDQPVTLPETDNDGIPWDARIHSPTPTLTAAGVWRKKKNVTAEEVAKVQDELLEKLHGGVEQSAPAPVAPPVAAPVPMAPPVAAPAPVAPPVAAPAPMAPPLAAPAPMAPPVAAPAPMAPPVAAPAPMAPPLAAPAPVAPPMAAPAPVAPPVAAPVTQTIFVQLATLVGRGISEGYIREEERDAVCSQFGISNFHQVINLAPEQMQNMYQWFSTMMQSRGFVGQ